MSVEDQDEQAPPPPVEIAEPGQAESDYVLPSPLKRRLSKLRWRAHCLAPNLIPHPGGDMDFDPAHDQEENEKSRVDLGLELRAPIIWGVELYGPAEIRNLYAGLKKLNWSRAGGWKQEHHSVSQIRRMRSHGAGAWVNLGIVKSRGDEGSFSIDKNFAALPDGVGSLIVSASQITPSLTALVIGFRLKEPLAQRYESELNKDRRTLRRRRPGTWTIEWVEPGHQKQRAVNAVRSGRRAMVGAWFAHNLPGYFSGLNLRDRYPTMELLVARGLDLRDEESGSRALHSWQRLLMNPSPYESWDSAECPGLQVGLEWHFDEDTGRHVYITLDTTAFQDTALQAYGGPSLRAYSFYCDRRFTNFLVHIAAIEFLRIHAQDLHTAREHLKTARSESRDVAKTLGEIGRFFDRTLGAPAIIRELAVHSQDEIWFRRSCGDFGADAWQDDGGRRMLYKDIQSGVRNRSTRLTDDEASLRTHFEQLTTILSVQENIRLQRRTLLLTVIALAVAFGSLLIAIYGPSSSKGSGQPDVPESAAPLDVPPANSGTD